jgi:hypothetical protein
MMNDEDKTGRAEARKSRRAEKTICDNPFNLWTVFYMEW